MSDKNLQELENLEEKNFIIHGCEKIVAAIAEHPFTDQNFNPQNISQENLKSSTIIINKGIQILKYLKASKRIQDKLDQFNNNQIEIIEKEIEKEIGELKKNNNKITEREIRDIGKKKREEKLNSLNQVKISKQNELISDDQKSNKDTDLDSLTSPDQNLIDYFDGNEYNNLLPENQDKIKEVIYNLFKNQLYLMAILICRFYQDNLETLNKGREITENEKDSFPADFVNKILEKLQALNKVKGSFFKELAIQANVSDANAKQFQGGNNEDNTISKEEKEIIIKKRTKLLGERRTLQEKLNNLRRIQNLKNQLDIKYPNQFFPSSLSSRDPIIDEYINLLITENVDTENKIFGQSIQDIAIELENQIKDLNRDIKEINNKLNQHSSQRQNGGALGNVAFSKFMYKASKYMYLTDKAFNKI